jgi:hypothetical protein
MWRYAGMLGVLLLIAGCQSTHEDLIARGYPPAFADGFDDGCVSGRQAAGSISGEFRKNVPRYLKDKRYANAPGNNRKIRTRDGPIARSESFTDIHCNQMPATMAQPFITGEVHEPRIRQRRQRRRAGRSAG